MFLFFGPASIAANAETGEHPAVKILATDYPPFEMEQAIDGLRGFDHEVVAEVFKRKKLKTEIVYIPWSRALSNARKGEADALLSCAYTEERTNDFYYSEAISQEVYGVYFRKDLKIPHLIQLQDLNEYSVAAVSGYIASADLEELEMSSQKVPSDLAGLKMLALNRFDFFYTGKAIADFLIKRNAMQGSFDFRLLSSKDYYLCFSKKAARGTELLDLFNEGLAEIQADGTYEAIHSKYR
jgi:polar amino acid transport system substrate-binding protein